MAEDWVPTTSSPSLSGRKSQNTGPEIELRRALHALGVRFRLHRKLAPACTPDIVLPGRRIAVWVDGCYWHSCPDHGRTKPFTGPSAERWRTKMERTRARDVRAVETAEALGWSVARVWEHDIRADAVTAARVVLACVTTESADARGQDMADDDPLESSSSGKHAR